MDVLNIKGSVLKTEIKSENVVENDTEQTVQGNVVKIEIQDDSENLKVPKNEQILQGSAITIKIENSENITEAKKSLRGKTLECDTCGKIFKNSRNFIYHVRIHSGEKPYECGTCNISFTQPSSLKSHQKIHAGVKPPLGSIKLLKKASKVDI